MKYNGKEYNILLPDTDENSMYKSISITSKYNIEEFLEALLRNQKIDYEINSEQNVVDSKYVDLIPTLNDKNILKYLSLGYGLVHDCLEIQDFADNTTIKEMKEISDTLMDIFYREGEYEPSIYDYFLYRELSKDEIDIIKNSEANIETLITLTGQLHKDNKILSKDFEQYVCNVKDAYEEINTDINFLEMSTPKIECEIFNYDNIKSHCIALIEKNKNKELQTLIKDISTGRQTYEMLNKELQESLFVGKLDVLLANKVEEPSTKDTNIQNKELEI